MMRRFRSLGVAAVLASSFVFATSGAEASTAIEFPDNWVGQFSRGGAWLATADAPVAGFYNPAALATQPNGFNFGANFVMRKICFTRVGPDGAPQYPDSSWDSTVINAPYQQVCNKNHGFPRFIPNLAFNWRVSERLAFGFTVVPPSSMGKLEWPMTQEYTSEQGDKLTGPAAQRYLSVGVEGTILFPTLSFGYSVLENFQLGAGFVIGVIPSLKLKTVSMSRESDKTADSFGSSDNLSTLDVSDMFIPGFVASFLWSPLDNFDVAAWYKWLDKAKLKGDISVLGPLWDDYGQPRAICEPGQDPDIDNCSAETNSDTDRGIKNDASLSMTLPMEARIGFRYHSPRFKKQKTRYGWERPHEFAGADYTTRDSLRDDIWDIELDLTWANNSAAKEIAISFREVFQPTGLPSTIPPRSDRPTGWKDTFGLRLGGQYNVLEDQLGLRAGTWFETAAVDAEFLTATGVPALRGGIAGGLVMRFGAVDLAAGYMFVWNAGLDNGGNGEIAAIVGSAQNKDVGYGGYKSHYAVNDGHIDMHANIVSVGISARW